MSRVEFSFLWRDVGVVLILLRIPGGDARSRLVFVVGREVESV